MLVLPYSFLLPEQDIKPCPQSHMLFSDRTCKLSGGRKATSPAFMMRPEVLLTQSHGSFMSKISSRLMVFHLLRAVMLPSVRRTVGLL